MNTLLSPLSFLERSAAAFPDRIAVIDEERRLTWVELRERVRRLAIGLQRSGIEKDDRVAFLALNTVELLEAHFGVPAAGGVLVAINTRLTADEVAYILDHSGARIVVVDPSLAHLVGGAGVERVLVCGEGGDYEEFLASAGDGEPEDRLESEEDTISINYTSGTTGRPKGVMYTHRGAYLNALSEVMHAHLDSGSVYLWTLPMFHCNGWCFTWAVTAVGARHVCLRKVDPPRRLEAARRGGRHAPERRSDRARDARRRRDGETARAARARHHGGRGAAAGGDRAHRGARLPDQPPLRPDRDVRADHDLRVEPGLGRARHGGAGPAARRARA